ncbi:hypothetical protein AaE_012434 [Aphanomyces astaci]|uniref:Uncharacterized protein n=1 Tax=Aphanomyces astaci TaxID=112090 RepID=A0A6A4ZG81_APHAT|nr:hypothetical protein AaE_012434 [Aphanomyces astaci]
MLTPNDDMPWRWTMASTPNEASHDNVETVGSLATTMPSVLYSDDAMLFLSSSLTEDQRAVLADCNQMRNFGRPGYEHEWAPSEHQASAALADAPPAAAAASPLALAEAWSADLLQNVWSHTDNTNTHLALMGGGIVVAFVAVVALIVTRITGPSTSHHLRATFDEDGDEFDPDDVYHPLL